MTDITLSDRRSEPSVRILFAENTAAKADIMLPILTKSFSLSFPFNITLISLINSYSKQNK